MQLRFLSAWSTIPEQLQSILQPIFDQPDFSSMLTAEQAEQIKSHCQYSDDELAFALLPLAAACAITPVSHFNVGAIARGISGNIYFGANMEFLQSPLQQSVHAEQSAITHAWLRGEKQLVSITVNYSPCGHCRQFMNELRGNSELQIHLPGRDVAKLHDYLPYAFGPTDLNISTLLMDSVDQGYSLESDDVLVKMALAAANRSHAPYSESYSGIALQHEDGSFFIGQYAENAAFNPSFPPLQAALVLMNLSGKGLDQIKRAVLVEGKESIVSQWVETENVLKNLGCQQIELHHFA
nr:cytidine deaminase [uncultured Moellerella sp.]